MNTTHFPPTLSDPQTRVRSCRKHGNSSSSCGQWRTSRTGLETWRARWHQRTSAGTSSLSITSSRSMLYVSLSAVSLSFCPFCLPFFGSVSLFCLSCLSPCQTISFNSMKTHTYSFYLHHLPVYFLTHTSTSFTYSLFTTPLQLLENDIQAQQGRIDDIMAQVRRFHEANHFQSDQIEDRGRELVAK